MHYPFGHSELQPLTDSMGASYGSGDSASGEEGRELTGRCQLVDVEGEEFVVVTSSSEGEDSRQCSCELIDGDQSQGPPPPTHSGILKTSHGHKVCEGREVRGWGREVEGEQWCGT